MKQGLTYKGFDLDIGKCEKTSDCQCDLCQGCTFILEMMAGLLQIVADNGLIDMYHYLLVNMDGMFQRTHDLLNGDKTIH